MTYIIEFLDSAMLICTSFLRQQVLLDMTCIALCLLDFVDDLHIIFEAACIARYDVQFHISISISHDLHVIYLPYPDSRTISNSCIFGSVLHHIFRDESKLDFSCSNILIRN
jgi:hypothetical protein